MKNTQLRRLNKVLHKNTIKTIDCISPGYVTFLEDRKTDDNFGDWEDLDEVSFIELTDEMLLKCCKKVADGEYTYNKCYFEVFENNELYYSANEGIKLSEPIKHVHQLQNIIFTLTNQELTINL